MSPLVCAASSHKRFGRFRVFPSRIAQKTETALDQGLAFWLLLRNGKSNSPLGETTFNEEKTQRSLTPAPLPREERFLLHRAP
jgi:hypothetical protein